MPKTIKTALLLTVAALSGAQAQQYTKGGEFILPKDYRHWDFLSSSVAMSYPEEGPGGHAMFGNLFVQPTVRAQFEKTGTWPDQTVLLMELRGVGGNDPFLNKDAEFQTDIMGYEAHVKDSARGGWAFYLIRKDADSGKALPKTANCFACHESHGAVDTTFVQYYPTLIDAAKKHGTYKDPQRPIAQTPAASVGIATKILMREPLGDTSEPKMSLFFLNVAAGVTIPSHTHAGAVFGYLLQGEIENQVEPDPPQVYQPGGFFHERPMQVHRLLRNLRDREPAKILIFQNTGTMPANVKPLLQEPLTNLANQEVTVMTLVAAPGAAPAGAHQHPAPVFAYVLKGEIESQVDPDPPKIYRAGDVFYEPPMHAHRLFRNPSMTEPAELLIFQVSEMGQPRAMGVKE